MNELVEVLRDIQKDLHIIASNTQVDVDKLTEVVSEKMSESLKMNVKF